MTIQHSARARCHSGICITLTIGTLLTCNAEHTDIPQRADPFLIAGDSYAYENTRLE